MKKEETKLGTPKQKRKKKKNFLKFNKRKLEIMKREGKKKKTGVAVNHKGREKRKKEGALNPNIDEKRE